MNISSIRMLIVEDRSLSAELPALFPSEHLTLGHCKSDTHRSRIPPTERSRSHFQDSYRTFVFVRSRWTVQNIGQDLVHARNAMLEEYVMLKSTIELELCAPWTRFLIKTRASPSRLKYATIDRTLSIKGTHIYFVPFHCTLPDHALLSPSNFHHYGRTCVGDSLRLVITAVTAPPSTKRMVRNLNVAIRVENMRELAAWCSRINVV